MQSYNDDTSSNEDEIHGGGQHRRGGGGSGSGDRREQPVPGWQDQLLLQAAEKEMADLQQHKVWWDKKNNGVSKSWAMQDGCCPSVTRYKDHDGAPWVFVYHCSDSGIPAGAMDAIFVFSQHAIVNMRGAVLPTDRLTPKLEATGGPSSGDISKRWKASAIWRHVNIAMQDEGNQGNGSSSSPPPSLSMASLRNSRRNRQTDDELAGGSSSTGNNREGSNLQGVGHWHNRSDVCIHDMDLDEGMPYLDPRDCQAASMDLEKQAPLRIELFFPRVFHYPPEREEGAFAGADSILEGNINGNNAAAGANASCSKVLQKVFCMVVVTPARNFSLAEYVRMYIVENTMTPESIHRKELLREILLDQIGLCYHLRRYMYTASGVHRTDGQNGHYNDESVHNPLDILNMPSHDLFPGNYLCIQMAYRKMQYGMRKAYNIDHRKIYIEGFSKTVSKLCQKDLKSVREFNFMWHNSFYEQSAMFENIKPEERGQFKAALEGEIHSPWWPREGQSTEEDALLLMTSSSGPSSRGRRFAAGNSESYGDDEADEDGGGDDSDVDMQGNPFAQRSNNSSVDSPLNKLYTGKDRIPAIMMSLLYDPLTCLPVNISRSEWEQKVGGLPAFHVYCMSRAIYSSSSNPLLKPEHFMPEATDMTATERWKEYMGEGDNPLINFYVAGKLFSFIFPSIIHLSI